MTIRCESNVWEDYVAETEHVDFSHPAIQELSSLLYTASLDETDFVKHAYEYVRDRISHSWDIRSTRITCKASEVLRDQEGICYAKSNLLCALLRSKGIPAGFCYQRLTLGDTPDTGHCVHALNAVYLTSIGRWVRLDARGNKIGIDAQFSVSEEKLAFPVRPAYDEIDYPLIHSLPHPKTIEALQQHTNCITMCLNGLPSAL
ncbi:transglutaminase family protein [Paenibacillus rhizovicinus]|uniref:Transglutaminase family protein n=1 Tax=Paenibacillus rhizovicinus TaxID=2704463 RepID=A0A6C0P3K1_9BACL|nr:transglutaminase family protein [Paenibacillus rhizovicinus]QHW33059.1 transglutaminase family protein [Paenibacillus rhizovicinus]